MGLLVLGTPLTWEESKKYIPHVREHGIQQLLNLWDRVKNREGDQLLWGDEVSRPFAGAARILTLRNQIEYMVVAFDDDTKNAKLSLCQSELLPKLQHLTNEIRDDGAIDA